MKNLLLILVGAAVLFGLSTIIIVDETEQIVILQFGKPVRTLKGPWSKLEITSTIPNIEFI